MAKGLWSTPFFGRKPKAKKEEQAEYGPGRADIMICPVGHEVYYHKSWHHNFRDYKELDADKRVKFKLCPADEMKKHGLFEGQVIFENVPQSVRGEVRSQIDHINQRAYDRDPMDRILETHENEGRIELRTSENQLALNIARQVHRAHKKTEMDTSFSKEESPVRIHVTWPQK